VLIDGDKDAAEVGESEEEVIDGVPYLAVEPSSDDSRQAYTVHATERMVGGENKTSFRRDMFFSADIKTDIEIIQKGKHEINAVFVMIESEDVIDLILMDNADEVIEEERG
jgi:hypothetical protein